MNTRSFWLSVLISGLVIGLLGGLPILNLVNCFLCIWIWMGGVLAVSLYWKYQRGEAVATVGQGAGLGAVAGLIGAFVAALVFAVTGPLHMSIYNNMWRAGQLGGISPFWSAGFWEIVISALGFLFVDLVLYPLFGAIGGMIAASIMKKPATA
jgi:hypothetical protein